MVERAEACLDKESPKNSELSTAMKHPIKGTKTEMPKQKQVSQLLEGVFQASWVAGKRILQGYIGAETCGWRLLVMDRTPFKIVHCFG